MTAVTYSSSSRPSAKRDIDLFGVTTVCISAHHGPGAPGVPILYLSAYVEDADWLTMRVIGALEYLDDGADRPSAVLKPAVVPAAPYPLHDFVEDVDYGAVLLVAENPVETDWKAWAACFVRMVRLSTTADQLNNLTTANAAGLKLCPYGLRGPISAALQDAYTVTAGQVAA